MSTGIELKMARYGIEESDLLREHGHAFVDVAKLGFKNEWKACLDCGIVRRADGKNKPCKGPVALSLRNNGERENAAAE